MGNIARLGVILGLSSSEFTTGIDQAKSKTKELKSSFEELKGALEKLAIAEVAMELMKFSDEISDTADAYGTTIKNVLDLGEALQQSGGQAENAGKVMAAFTKEVNAAAEGGKSAQEAFKKVGVSLSDLHKLSIDDLFKKTLEGLTSITDPITRNATAFEILGKAIKGVDLTKMSEEMLAGVGATDEQVVAIRVLGDAWDKFHNILFETKLFLTELLAPAIYIVQRNLEALMPIISLVGQAFKILFIGAVAAVNLFIESIKYASSTFSNFWQLASEVMSGNVSGSMDRFFERQAKNYQNFLAGIKGMENIVRGIGNKGAPSESNRTVTAAKDSEADKQKNMLYTATLISAEYERQLKFAQQQLQTRNAMVGMTNDERKIQEAINQVLDKTSAKIDEITKKREDAAGRGASKDVLAEYDKQIDKVRALGNAYAQQAGKIEQATIESQRTFSFGWNKAFKQYAEDAYNNASLAASMFGTFTGAMNQAIANFVQTGKFQFADFVKSVLQGLIQIQLQMLAMRLFSAAIGAFSTTPGISTNPEYMGPPSPFAPKADGGSVLGNTPYLVGERGPELFVPNRSGTIVPNGQNTMGYGQAQTVINGPYIANMSAIDTQSATQFLAKNKAAIYAANMSASRSIPTSVR